MLRKKIIQKRTFGFSVDERESQEVINQAIHLLENLLNCKTTNMENVYRYSQENLVGSSAKTPIERFQDNESLDISESIKEISFKSHDKQKLKSTLDRNMTTKIIETKFEDSEHSKNSLGEEIEYNREEEIQRKIKELNQKEFTFKKLNNHKNSLTNLTINRAELDNIIEEEAKQESKVRVRNFSNKKSLRSFKHYNKDQILLKKEELFSNFDKINDRNKGVSFYKDTNFKEKSIHTVSLKEKKVPDLNDLSKIKDFNFKNIKYHKGDWVDALDNQNIWQEAQVISVESDRIKIHFNGTDQENDQWIPLVSQRIGLFRSHTTDIEGSYFLSPVPSKKVQMKLEQQARDCKSNNGINFL